MDWILDDDIIRFYWGAVKESFGWSITGLNPQ